MMSLFKDSDEQPAPYYSSPVLHLVTCDSFGERVAVLEEEPGLEESRDAETSQEKVLSHAYLVRDRATHWPGMFLNHVGP